MQNQEKSPGASLTPSAESEAQQNLERRLEEAGLPKALDRIYPATGLRRVPMGPRFPDSFAQVSDETPRTVAYSQRPKSGSPE